MYENLNEIKETSLKEKLKRGKDSAFLSKKIATIVRSTPVSFDPSLSKLKQVDRIKVVEVLKRYNFKSLIRRMGFEEESGGVKKVEIDKSQLSML